MRKPRARKGPPKPPTDPEFRRYAHVMLDTLLDDYPGTDAVAIIVDGLSGQEVASHPSSLSVKRGLFSTAYTRVFPDGDPDE